MSTYIELLDKLEGLKQTGPDRWLARCPAHDDNNPSLRLKDTGDRLLVYCFAGCTFRDIADALGVLPSAFFEGGIYDRREFDKKFPVPWKDAVIVLRHEFWVLLTIANALQKGPLSDTDDKRLIEAGRRIEQAWRACNG